MSFREVQVHEIREVLRLWLRGEGQRAIARLSAVDRKTVRRYVGAATACGLARDGGEGQLGDELIGSVCEAVRPHRPDGHGQAWATLKANHDQLKAWLVDDGLTVVKAHDLLTRRGTVVPERTLHRYALEVLGVGRSARTTTVRVADCEPGSELQVDFGKMGLIADPATGKDRVVWALIFTAVYSRHCFVWLSLRQTTEAVIAGCEAAWSFFGGVFAVVIPDNMAAIVDKADPLSPRLNRAFMEYAQARGFVTDPARVRTPTDKPRVERVVPFVRSSMFAGERFVDLDHAQRHAEGWCRTRAGLRTHGTTQCRPAELFALEEQPRLLAAPASPYDLPVYAQPKVHRDHHVEVAKALYSVPGNLIGCRVDARADQALVRISHRGQLVKVHPRMPRWRAQHRSRRPAVGENRLRPARHRGAQAHGRSPRPRRRRLRGGGAGAPAAVDQDAPGLRPVGPGQAVGAGAGRGRVRPGAGGRGHQRGPHRADDRAGHRGRARGQRSAADGQARPLRPWARALRHRRRTHDAG